MPDQPEKPHASDEPAATINEPASAATEGAPDAGDGEVDPELVRLPTPRRRRSPLATVAALGLAGVLLAHLAPDLRYAISQRTPEELGNARAVRFADGARLADNTLVAVSGLPDYRNALLFEPKGDNYRRAFFRLLGTSSRLWVRAEETSTRHELGERVVGRLRRFDALPYADQVRSYYGTLHVTRLLDLAPFQRRARGQAGDDIVGSLTDGAGERVALPDPQRAQVTVWVEFPDELELSLSKERFAVEEDARREVERLGAPLAFAHDDKEVFRYVVRVEPAKQSALLAACEKQDFPVRARRERYVVPLPSLLQTTPGGELALHPAPGAPPFYSLEGQALVARPPGSEALLPWARVASIQVDAPVEIPHDAWVVIEGDLPSGYGWAKGLAVLLLLLAAFNGWLLTRSVRGR